MYYLRMIQIESDEKDSFFPIYLKDKIIGRTTSGNYSFNYNKNISFGYINSNYSKEDLLNKELYIEVEKKKYPAILLLEPLNDRLNINRK